MDIFSHAAWAAVAGRGAEKKIGRKLNTWFVVFWGIFPDLFAFTIPFVWMFAEVVSGNFSLNQLPEPGHQEPPEFLSKYPIFKLASSLYNVSHSLVVIVFALLFAWSILRRMPWEMLAWPFHVFIDIPTHPASFYATPLFWPVSDWKFTHGFSWGTPWFMAIDILLLAATCFYLYKKGKLFRKW